MKLYLVRHGQSIGNLNKIHQNSSTPLSDLGRKQATELVKRFSSIPLDIILTSDHARAHDTAKIIADGLGKDLEVSNQLREIKRPSVLEGKSTTDPSLIPIKEAMITNLHDPSWHHSDEENISELITRSREFLVGLTNRSEQNILAVSHGNFIGAVVGIIVLGDLLTPEIYKSMEKSMYISNTGISVLENINNQWHLITWNDNAHLGNL